MLKKLWYRACVMAVLVFSLSGCSAIRGIGNALTHGFKGFSIHFP
jgi:predicted small secreted protein